MGGGKSGGAIASYNYYGTLAGGVCIGPDEAIVSIILNGQEVWPQGIPWAVGITCLVGTNYVFDAQTWHCTTQHVASAANAPGSGLEGWTEYVFTRGTETYDDFTITGSDGTAYGVMRFYWGSNAQTVDALLQSTGNDSGVSGQYGSGDQHPDYEGFAYVLIMDFLLGQEVQSGPNLEIVVRRVPNQSIITGTPATVVDGQANLAAVAVELLTDENCLGLSTAMIDETSFQTVANWLQTYQLKYGASVLIDTSENIAALFDRLVQMFDGYIRFNPSTGLIELGVYYHGVTPATYVTLTADSLTAFPKFNTQSWQKTISRATVRFNSRQLNYQQTSVQVDDARAFFVLQSVREQALDCPWIARPQQAFTFGQEALRVIGHAQMTGTLMVRREIGRTIRAGDYVLVDVDLEPNANSLLQFFRVTERKIPPTGPIELQVFADNTLAPVPWVNAMTPVIVTEPAIPPVAVFRFLEVPTLLSNDRGAIICLTKRPSNILVGAELYFDTNSGGAFSNDLGAINGFAAKASLHANVAAADTTIQLTVDTTQADADYFTQQYTANQAADDTMLLIVLTVSGSQVAENASGYAEMEIMSVSVQTLISAGRYNLTALRGRQNTEPLAFATGSAEAWLIPKSLLTFFNSALFDQIRANRITGVTPNEAQFRICPFTFSDSYPLADAVSEAFQFPLASATVPALVLTSPANYSPSVTGVAAWPYLLEVAGTWSSQDGNLVEIITTVQKSTATAPTVVADTTFAQTASRSFQTYVQFEQPGTYTVMLTARDSTNLITQVPITVTLAGTVAPKCALPQFFDANGIPIVNTMLWLGSPLDPGYKSGTATVKAAATSIATGLPSNSYLWYNYRGTGSYGRIIVAGYNSGNFTWAWGIVPTQNIPFDRINMGCSTPGAIINFVTTGLVQSGTALSRNNQNLVYAPGVLQPSNALTTTEYLIVYAWATAAGYATSDVVALYIPQAQ